MKLTCIFCGNQIKSKRNLRFCSLACKGKAQIGKPMPDRESEKHWGWKGNEVGIDALHDWVRRRKRKPVVCECCAVVPPRDCANISGKYKRDIKDFEWLCRRCHMRKDGRLLKIGKYSRNKKQ